MTSKSTRKREEERGKDRAEERAEWRDGERDKERERESEERGKRERERERERKREREERERERERQTTTTTMHLNFIHFFLLPLQKKKFQGSSCFTLLRTKANKFNVCYSIFSPRCRCAEDFFEEIFQGLRENRRSRASCRCAYVVAISFSEK